MEMTWLRQLIELLKSQPQKYAYGSAGIGNPQRISGEMFKSQAGAQMQPVPHRGSGPMITEVRGGTLPLAVDNVATAVQHIKSGKLRAFAVAKAQRSGVAPDVPTMAEFGLLARSRQTWPAQVAPRHTLARTPAAAATP